ncbi:MAG: phosphoethanolamine--lipid A transferase [Arcobacteraceae bacterium]
MTQQTKLILLVSVFLVLTGNFTFFSKTLEFFPLDSITNILFMVTLVINFILFVNIILLILSSKYTTKPLIILLLSVSSSVAYFTNSYNVVIDHNMIQNMFETSVKESMDLLTFKMILYFLFLGILPSIIVFKTKVDYGTLKSEVFSKLKSGLASFGVILVSVLILSSHYTSFFRGHKELRTYANPTFYMYSFQKYIKRTYFKTTPILQSIGNDAKIVEEDIQKDRELVIMVVGETARADRFGLNGYEKDTNPLLKQENIFNFEQMYSCGTATAVSVPCMFSIYGKDNYGDQKVKYTENALDILRKSGVNILWRDNNSDSKGVALRVEYQDYQSPKLNTICDGECRDEGMLVGLQEYIDSHKEGDIFIVLHQMGNHGPAYYKRYPKEFEKFTPVCKDSQLENCTKEEIDNAYDNAILYTDYFLSKVIDLLKKNDDFETAMVYMSDHGESLGENNIYLHGLPYMIAPQTQKHVPAIFWFGSKISKELDINKLQDKLKDEFNHDYLFHTMLGLFEVDTQVYKKELDILSDIKKE